jgi:hypothetical protein
MYNQSPILPSGGLLRGRPLAPNKVVVPAANPRYDVIPVTQPPIPLSRPRPYPSFSSYPLPENSDPLTLHQLSTTSQLEVTTTSPTRHYTHFSRLDAVSFNKQVCLQKWRRKREHMYTQMDGQTQEGQNRKKK